MDLSVHLLFGFALPCLVFGAYIFKLDASDVLRRVFLLLCVVIAASSCIAALAYSAKDRESIAFWERINFVSVVICWAVNLHFYVLFTDHKLRLCHFLLLYGPAAALVAVDLAVCHIVEDYIQSGNQWKYVFSPMYYAYIAYSIAYFTADIALVYKWARKGGIKKHRLQMRMILGTTIPLWSVCIVLDYIMPHFSSYGLPPVGPFGRMLYIFILWLSFVRYRFMTPASSILLRNIVLNMDEIVTLLDRDARILIRNGTFDKIAGNRSGGRKSSFFDFVDNSTDFKDKMRAVIERRVEYSHLALDYKNPGGSISTSTYLSGVLDNYGDAVGVLVISRENRGIKEFRIKYKISERQMEIINLMLAGESNNGISEKLGIAKKTTESHIFNIYCKLGIENKIELYNFAAGFRLIPSREASSG